MVGEALLREQRRAKRDYNKEPERMQQQQLLPR